MTHCETSILSIRRWILFFVIMLVLSGITAFPVETELGWICSWWPEQESVFYKWLLGCYEALRLANKAYPFLAYGYDWLAFSHIVIGVFFIGPYRDPLRNIWVIDAAMIACVMVIPLAFIAGEVRSIPVFWRLLDASFGVLGLLPLFIVKKKIQAIEHRISKTSKTGSLTSLKMAQTKTPCKISV